MSGLEDSRAWPVIEVIGLTVFALILSLFLGVIFGVFLLALGYDISLDSTSLLLGVTILGQIAFLILAVFYVRYREVKVPIEIPSRSDLGYIGGGTVITLLAAVALSQIIHALDLMPESVIEDIAEQDPRFLLALAILSVILVAPAEELFFRGAIQGRLRQNFGPLFSIIIASILFGALHLGNYAGEILPIIMGAMVVTVASLILGGLYEKTENLIVPILVHAIYNVILLLPAYFAFV